jgi:hypothetical protein
MRGYLYRWTARLTMKKTLLTAGSLFLLAAAVMLSHAPKALANSTDISNARTKYPNIVGTRIDSCFLCHTGSIPGLNPYGAAYKANGRKVAAFALIESADSDGDGASNLAEIMALTFPGDPADVPAAPTSTPPPPPTSTPPPPPTNTPLPPTDTPTTPPTAAPTNTPTSPPPPGVTASPIPTIVGTAIPTATFTAIPSGTPRVGPTATMTPHCHDDDCRGKKNPKHPNKHKRHRHRHRFKGR